MRNAIDDHVIHSLTDAFKTLGADGETRIVVLTGRGAAFSAGADLDWMRRMAAGSEAENFASAKTISAMMRTLNELPKPTIARINGAAYAAGVGLIAACDIAVAVEAAVFSISEVRIGLVPSTIGPYVLAAIGARAARRYFLTGEPLLAGGPHSQSRAKRLIAEVAGRPVDDALEALTARSIAEARASPEGREGIEAFLNKRRPAWRHE